MQNNETLQIVTQVALLLAGLLSLVLVAGSYSLPGGSVAAGVLLSLALLAYAANAAEGAARRVRGFNYLLLAAFGLFFALTWGIVGLLAELPFLTGIWTDQTIPGIGAVGSPVLFNVGIFLLVVGALMQAGVLLLFDEPLK